MKSILASFAFITILASCGNSNKEAELMRAQQRTIDSLNAVTAFQAQQLDQQEQKEEEKVAAAASTQRNYTSTRSTAKRSTASKSYSSNSPSYGTIPTATQPTQQKKGWSNKAKGAVIGGVVGAGAGAIISKNNKWKGGVIGGVLGAGAGYGVGAILDNKKKNQ